MDTLNVRFGSKADVTELSLYVHQKRDFLFHYECPLTAKSGHSPDTNKRLVNTESGCSYVTIELSGGISSYYLLSGRTDVIK